MNFRNSMSLLPSTSVKLSIFHVMTVVNRSPGGGASLCQRSVMTGCHVLCHVKPLVGMVLAAVPTLAPNVKRWSKVLKNFTYHPSPLAIASCVKTGSESTKTRRGMLRYSSRQNHEPPDKFTNSSASAQKAWTRSRETPWYSPLKLTKDQRSPNPNGSSAALMYRVAYEGSSLNVFRSGS